MSVDDSRLGDLASKPRHQQELGPDAVQDQGTAPVATLDAAGAAFAEAVVRPVESVAPGLRRLDALLERSLDYAAAPLLPGGCSWTATGRHPRRPRLGEPGAIARAHRAIDAALRR